MIVVEAWYTNYSKLGTQIFLIFLFMTLGDP